MFSFSKARAVCVFVLTLSVSGLTQAAISQIYAFGDSLSDTGNIFATTMTPVPPYYDGNFSNGPVWVEGLADILGVTAPTPSLDGGTNYAWGGARTTELAQGFIPSTQTQVQTYLDEVGGFADPDALYTILTGGNDLLGVSNGSVGIPELIAAGAAVASIANDLLLAGAQNILVINVPDLGGTPASDGNEDAGTLITTLFNDALFQGLVELNSEHVDFLDAFTLSQQIAADPAAYGLTNVDDNCFEASDGMGGPMCDTYLFWDDVHPTAAGHEIFAMQAAAAVVPLPAAVWFFGSALMGLVVLKRKS